ncbi:MAG: hypothetical protein WBB65_11505 [Anaerolineales bacterium]
MTVQEPEIQPPSRLRIAADFLLIAIVFWAARHIHHSGFGFYEDDFTLVVWAMKSPWYEVWEFVYGLLTQFGGQGRPLQHSLIAILAHATGKFGGIMAAQWLSYIIVTINCVLFYLLLKKIFNRSYAIIGVLAYSLFSADTTQAFVYHALGLQQSLTFFILASFAYLSGKRAISYLLILGTLLSYETPYLAFILVPLLERRFTKNKLREVLFHTLILLSIFLAIIGLRLMTGEGRVAALTFPDLITVPLSHMIQGPIVALGTYIYRPIQAIQNLNTEMILLLAVAFPVFSWVLLKLKFSNNGSPSSPSDINATHDQKETDNILRRTFAKLMEKEEDAFSVRLALIGIGMLILAYPFTFTIRAFALSGRDTRVHFGAAIGAAIVWASVLYLVLSFAERYRKKKIVAFTFAAIFSLLLAFGLVIQWDYQKAWRLQQDFWSGVVDFVPDLTEGTVILVDPEGLDDTVFIDANTWNLPLIMQYIFEFPNSWQSPLPVHRLLPDWRDRVLFNSLEIKAVDYKWEYVVVPWKDAVILETDNSRIVRRLESVELDGATYELKKPETDQTTKFPKGYLYDVLIRDQLP